MAALRHLLPLARDEWEVLAAAPRIRLEREPQGRVLWLEPADGRLLEACGTSRTKYLADVVTVALETGLRKAELLGLTWARIDLSRGVLRLEVTKSGAGGGVPMRQAATTCWPPCPAFASLIYAHLSPAHLRAEVAKIERPAMPAPIPAAVSTKSAQSSSATVESEKRVR